MGSDEGEGKIERGCVCERFGLMCRKGREGREKASLGREKVGREVSCEQSRRGYERHNLRTGKGLEKVQYS